MSTPDEPPQSDSGSKPDRFGALLIALLVAGLLVVAYTVFQLTFASSFA